MSQHWLTVKKAIWAVEMGAGKTLAALEASEHIFDSEIKSKTYHKGMFFWVAPRSALMSVEIEFEKWKSPIRPTFLTYEGLVKLTKNWISGEPAPRVVVFDESSYLKTHSAQRSSAAQFLADAVRSEHKENGHILLMSGTPAPKSPKDWWNQCEVACPGYLKEPDIFKFEKRLAIIDEKENPVTGGKYPHLVAWRDSTERCNICGEMNTHPVHTPPKDDYAALVENKNYHVFEACKNEVADLYERMRGLVMVKFKKDCLDLPDKRYELIRVTPTPSTLRAAKLIAKTQPTAIRVLTMLRELSDGFQYADTVSGSHDCPTCNGTGQATLYVDSEGNPITNETANEDVATCIDKITCGWSGLLSDSGINQGERCCPNCGSPVHLTTVSQVRNVQGTCPECNGEKTVPTIVRSTKEVESPKDAVFKDLLDRHSDVGRFVTFGGFTGTIDRLVRIALSEQWNVIRVDGRGWHTFAVGGGCMTGKPLDIFQNQLEKYPRVVFIAHPKTASTGLTLTASPGILYYSNDFNAQDRIQSEDRIHRPGMDLNRGATIYDIVHLPTDELILNNLKKKRELQSISLGEFQAVLG
jgi:hypothetical protein